ncbi:AraC family transcriptional regulator [Flavicella sediminum]|uniref:AraC family transcriptional regulator n=1 Tax=Flavicella sediminum TaxID=2585141 RepID=UPI001120DA1A|nr:helix-turn-helix transcriptional regulator [Flavicella sediminum]
MKDYPIYDIQKFSCKLHENDLYINTFKNHLLEHSFIESSHRHDFYLLVLFTKGTGIHKIDLNEFKIQAGSLFVIQPGQAHSWKLSKDIDGYIVFYTKEIYNLYFGEKKIEEYPFYDASKNISNINFTDSESGDLETYFQLLIRENQTNKSRKIDKLLNILDIIHIEISRKQLLENEQPQQTYQHKIKVFNEYLEAYYKEKKSPSFYAEKMHISLKHLNRICKDLLNKTVTELISQRVVLEAKRMLTFSSDSVSQIADALGYSNYSYFSKLFKKNTGFTPTSYKSNLKLEQW